MTTDLIMRVNVRTTKIDTWYSGRLLFSAFVPTTIAVPTGYKKHIIIIKIKIHSSCEIEDFVEAHICKLRVVLRSRVLMGVSS